MKVPQAGVCQRPFSKALAASILAGLDLTKIGLPLVNMRDGVAWIIDGQHRIAALKMWLPDLTAADTWECEIFEALTDKEMAECFLGRNDSKSVTPFDKFLISCGAERSRESVILRTVESNHLKVSRARENNCIASVQALGRVYDAAGDVVLGQVLRVLRDGYQGDPAAFDGQVVQGVGLVFQRYNGRTNERHLADAIGTTQYGVRGLLRRAETQRDRTGNQKVTCIAAVIVEIYNRTIRERKHKLPSWWKTDGTETVESADVKR